MIDEKVLLKLEYPKVLSYISKHAVTELAKLTINELRPSGNIDQAVKQGTFVTEAKNLLINFEYPPINYLPNLTDLLYKSKIFGSILTKNQVFSVLELAQMSRKLFSYLKNNTSENDKIFEFLSMLFVDKNFENNISKVFNEAGEISDNASKELKAIRNDIIQKSNALNTLINKIMKNLRSSYLVQEEFITQRDGRFVLPIKAEHKRHVKGFIHSESNSGQTVYIEPEETLDLNNEILSLSFAEKREIERILKNLTTLIGNNSQRLLESFNALTKIDIIFANAKYSLEVIGTYPILREKKELKIINGRHPILIKKIGRENSIPLNFNLKNNRVTLITGPNAGGKTVVLKTIGLLIALVQSGIHVPVDPDSIFYFFDKIMLDIGDEQSIEDDLSTFSSHLENIKKILENADNNSLILIDEIGTGTDPAEGTALAAAFLITMSEKDSTVIATTHHGNLKIIATELQNFQNASMEFDLENLKPTYVFRQGTAGSSYAFQVAEKIGFSNKIIKLAENYLDDDKNRVEKFIIDLENKSHELKKRLNILEIEQSRLQGLIKLYENENTKLNEQKNKILKETKEKAENILLSINKKFENTIKNIKESNADKNVIIEEKQKINEIKIAASNIYKPIAEIETTSQYFKQNDYVKIKDSLTEGIIIDLDVEKNIAIINSGNMRIKAKLNNLVKTTKTEKAKDYNLYNNIIQLESTKLDIRGYKPEEAEFEIIKFIDEAYLSNLKSVEIIHGKGTGVLREKVHEILKNHQMVKSFELASVEFGGAGATIIQLN